MHKHELSARRLTQLVQFTDTNDALKKQYLADSAVLMARLDKSKAVLTTTDLVRRTHLI
jgi:hypothetical protein